MTDPRAKIAVIGGNSDEIAQIQKLIADNFGPNIILAAADEINAYEEALIEQINNLPDLVIIDNFLPEKSKLSQSWDTLVDFLDDFKHVEKKKERHHDHILDQGNRSARNSRRAARRRTRR